MANIQQRLFTWEEIDSSSDLDRLRMVLAAVVDEDLVLALESRRGKGRDDYPVRATWNSILAGVIYQHPSVASLRRELLRNGELRHVCGFDPRPGGNAVPSANAYTNFLNKLLDHEELIESMFFALVERLQEFLGDLGTHTAIDSKAIQSVAKRTGNERRKDGDVDRRGDHDADWGKKTKRGKRDDGSAWEKVTAWFGFKLHLIVDSVHELPLAYEVTRASAADTTHLLPMVADLAEKHPALVERTETMSGDRGYDSKDNNEGLYEEYGIKPIIDSRVFGKDGDKTRLLDSSCADNVAYDEKGRVFCYCPFTEERREMAYWGFEKTRSCLKYRCPASAFGFPCKGREECPGSHTPYGRTVRIPLDVDRRIFTPLARSTPAWEKAYKRRTSVERVNSRLDNVLGFERHFIRGLGKMKVRVGLALVVMLAMAVGWLELGRRERIRSLTTPIRSLPRAA